MGEIFGTIGGQLLEWVLPSLLTAIGGLIAAVLTRYLKKLGLELNDAQQAQLRTIVEDAIAVVEERARRQKMTPAQKANAAEAIIIAQRPDLPTKAIAQAIDAVLPTVRSKLVPSTPATLGR